MSGPSAKAIHLAASRVRTAEPTVLILNSAGLRVGFVSFDQGPTQVDQAERARQWLAEIIEAAIAPYEGLLQDAERQRVRDVDRVELVNDDLRDRIRVLERDLAAARLRVKGGAEK